MLPIPAFVPRLDPKRRLARVDCPSAGRQINDRPAKQLAKMLSSDKKSENVELLHRLPDSGHVEDNRQSYGVMRPNSISFEESNLILHWKSEVPEDSRVPQASGSLLG